MSLVFWLRNQRPRQSPLGTRARRPISIVSRAWAAAVVNPPRWRRPGTAAQRADPSGSPRPCDASEFGRVQARAHSPRLQRRARVLFDHQDRGAFSAQLGKQVEGLLNDQRREPDRGFVDKDSFGSSMSPARFELLLFAAGERGGLTVSLAPQRRKPIERRSSRAGTSLIRPGGTAMSSNCGAQKVRKNIPALRDVADARGDELACDHLVASRPRPGSFLSGPDQAEDRLEHGRLAGAVRADDAVIAPRGILKFVR